MKKSIQKRCAGAAFCVGFISVKAAADTAIGLYGGVGAWNPSLSGSIGTDTQPITINELAIEKDTSLVLYLSLEHPIPFLPNIRVQHTILESQGETTIGRNFVLENVSFPAQAVTTTTLDLTQTDITFYYEMLDSWISFDVGVTAKLLDGSASINGMITDQDPIVETTSFDGAVPMLYSMGRMDLPFFNAYATGHINHVSYGKNSIRDLDAGIGWLYDTVVDIGAEIGYRKFSVKLNDLGDSRADLSYQGPYLTLAFHF